MNSTMEYNFDFSAPGHIQWSSGTQKQEFVMPEQPVRFVINDKSIRENSQPLSSRFLRTHWM